MTNKTPDGRPTLAEVIKYAEWCAEGDECLSVQREILRIVNEYAALTPPAAHERGALAVRFTLYTDKRCFGNSFVIEKHDFPFLDIICSDRFKELACAIRDEEGK